MARHFVFKFQQKPVNEAAHFGAFHRAFRQEAAIALQRAAGFIQIFGDDGCAHDGQVVFRQKHGQGAGRVQRQKLLAPRPRPFLDQFCFNAIFAENKTHIARTRRHGMMEKRKHDRRDTLDKQLEMVVRRWLGGWRLQI